jgi:uncharacterized protein YndB with AHSA1/START domain
MKRFVPGVFALALAQPAVAEVKAASRHGLEVESRVDLPLPPAALYRAFAEMPRWWDPEHSYSGSAANLRLALKAGGCWCETLPGGGGVEHMRVTYVEPNKRIVLTGSLGPLLAEATTGVMQIALAPTERGSSLVMNYRAAGFANGGADKLAPAVDQVLAAQMKRLQAYAERIGTAR